jgi:Uma2 family endonuclease
MAESTLQFQWIVTIQGNLDLLFHEREDVFVGGDNFVYPVEGKPNIATAPDVYVAIGRPRGHRGSYKVWEEGGVFPQVVFEVLSPSNTPAEMKRKRAFYQRYGAEEYYVYDPARNQLEGWRRGGKRLVAAGEMNGFTSPRLGIRFDLSGSELVIFHPDGQRFRTFLELAEQAEDEKRRADRLATKLRELGLDPDAV